MIKLGYAFYTECREDDDSCFRLDSIAGFCSFPWDCSGGWLRAAFRRTNSF